MGAGAFRACSTLAGQPALDLHNTLSLPDRRACGCCPRGDLLLFCCLALPCVLCPVEAKPAIQREAVGSIVVFVMCCFMKLALQTALLAQVPLSTQLLVDLYRMRELKKGKHGWIAMEAKDHRGEGYAWAEVWAGPYHVAFGHDHQRGLQVWRLWSITVNFQDPAY